MTALDAAGPSTVVRALASLLNEFGWSPPGYGDIGLAVAVTKSGSWPALLAAIRSEGAAEPSSCQYCGSVNGETPMGFHTDPMTGDTLRAAIRAACDLIDPRLSEVDWDIVAACFDGVGGAAVAESLDPATFRQIRRAGFPVHRPDVECYCDSCWAYLAEEAGGDPEVVLPSESTPLDAKVLGDAIWNVMYPGEGARAVLGEAAEIAAEYARLVSTLPEEPAGGTDGQV